MKHVPLTVYPQWLYFSVRGWKHFHSDWLPTKGRIRLPHQRQGCQHMSGGRREVMVTTQAPPNIKQRDPYRGVSEGGVPSHSTQGPESFSQKPQYTLLWVNAIHQQFRGRVSQVQRRFRFLLLFFFGWMCATFTWSLGRCLSASSAALHCFKWL